MEYLSNIELYYTPPENFAEDKIILEGEDFHHASKVMRHKQGEKIFVTDGRGNINCCEISIINKDHLLLIAEEKFTYTDKFKKIFFCIPRLKSADRFEFAMEKSVELGVTHFIIYDAERAVAKGSKTDRWNKIVLAAMKQSLRSFLPAIEISGGPDEIADRYGAKFVFEQNSSNGFYPDKIDDSEDSYFIFGPEGGLSEKELNLFKGDDIYKLSDTRLRSETAVIVCASYLCK